MKRLWVVALPLLAGFMVALPAQARIAYQSAKSAGVNGSTTLAVTKPAGTAANDALVASIAVALTAVRVTVPSSSWIEAQDVLQAGGNANRLLTFYLVAGSAGREGGLHRRSPT